MTAPRRPPPTAPRWARPAAFVFLCIVTMLVVAWAVGSGGGGEPQEAAAGPKATTTTTFAVRIPTANKPLRVLVAGDSLVGWIAPALEQELLAQDPVKVIDDWKGSTGLVRPDYFDWPARIEHDMEHDHPDVVVLGFGGNDTQNLTTDDGILLLGTPEWKAEYQRRIAEVLDLIEAPGRTVYWIGLPLTTSEPIETLRPVMTSAIKAELESRPWAHLVDTRKALAPDGTFTSKLPGDDGQLVTTMAPDQIHPSLDGGVRIVRVLLPLLTHERKLDA